MELCIICSEVLEGSEASVVLGEKGSQGINRASDERGDSIRASAGQMAHKDCRKKYCNPNNIRQSLRQLDLENRHKRETVMTRSREDIFTFSENGLFCGKHARLDGRKRGSGVFAVRTLDFQKTIQSTVIERGDEWAGQVKGRLEFANDLPAVDAVYHQSCNVNFRTFKQIPKPYTSDEKKAKTSSSSGRRGHTDAFLKVLQYLEKNDDEQVTIGDLVDIMKQINEGEAYDAFYMKQKLQDYFGSSIIITELNGKSNVVTFRRTAQSILHDHFSHPREADVNKEKLHFIKTAAKLIQSDIKAMKTTKAVYQTSDELSSGARNLEFIPETLILLLRTIFSEREADAKIASIGQTIVQAARPRIIIAPLQIGLGVQLHHHFRSKFLIDLLNNLGFCSSYSEVKKFETSAAANQGIEIAGFKPGQFVQYIADNVDHNVRTIDGHNTFHGMGIIAAITPATKSVTRVLRLNATSEDLCALGRINIHHYKLQNDFMSALIYERLNDITAEDTSWKLNLLSKISWRPKSMQPSWSGVMQMVQKGFHQGASSISFLPMIDMNPNDMSCVYSTLLFVCKQATQYGTDPIVTFDQPLYWKAFTIIHNEAVCNDLKNVVLRLGCFHTQMSFIGCIGHLMSGSGLQETLETVYASNAVVHMLSGKAIARDVRGHFLVDRALNHLLVAKVPGCTKNTSDMTDFDEDLQEARNLYEKILNGTTNATNTEPETLLTRIQSKIDSVKSSLSPMRTAKLWLIYMDMVDILKKFKASRKNRKLAPPLADSERNAPILCRLWS